MGSLSVDSGAGSSLHESETEQLKQIDLQEEYDVLQLVGEGWFARVLLVEHRATRSERVLKATPQYSLPNVQDFLREFHYSHVFGQHKSIVKTYKCAFQYQDCYYFAQELAPFGDLTSNVTEVGIGEINTKRVARQIASALEYVHSKNVVHGDVKMDNILVFKSDFSKVKLCDFSQTRPKGSMVVKFNEWIPYSTPEVAATAYDGCYAVDPSHDVWQYAILLCLCLTGSLPWQKAEIADPKYAAFVKWQSRTMNMTTGKTPKFFKPFSSKGRRMFRKLLEPKLEKRHPIKEFTTKYNEDKWMSKLPDKNDMDDDMSTSLSMMSFHSSATEKGKLLFTLSQFGIETNVDRDAKKDRIKAWVQTSAIEEEDETELPDDVSEEIEEDENLSTTAEPEKFETIV